MWKFSFNGMKALTFISNGLVLIMGIAQIWVCYTRRFWFAKIEPLILISFKDETHWVMILGIALVVMCIFGAASIIWSSYAMLIFYGALLFFFSVGYFTFGGILVNKSNNEALTKTKLNRIRHEMIKYRRPHPLYVLQKMIGCCGINDFTDLYMIEWYYWNFFKNYTGPNDLSGPRDEGLEDIETITHREDVASTRTLQPEIEARAKTWRTFPLFNDADEDENKVDSEKKVNFHLPQIKKELESEQLLKLLNPIIADYAKKKAARFFAQSWLRDNIGDQRIPGYRDAAGNKFTKFYSEAGWPAYSQGSDWYIPHMYFWIWLSGQEPSLYPTTIEIGGKEGDNYDFTLVQTCCKNPSKNCSRYYQKGQFHDDGCGRVVVAQWRKTCAELGAILITSSFMLLITFTHNLLYISGVHELLYL